MFLLRCCGRFSLEGAPSSWWLITWSLWRRRITLSSLRMERWWRRGHTLNSWPGEAATIVSIKIPTFYKVELPSETECSPSGQEATGCSLWSWFLNLLSNEWRNLAASTFTLLVLVDLCPPPHHLLPSSFSWWMLTLNKCLFVFFKCACKKCF